MTRIVNKPVPHRWLAAHATAVGLLLMLTGCFLAPPPHSDYRPIHQAALGCDTQAVEAILKTNAATINLPDDSRRTPLHDAASRNCTNVLVILIHAGAKLEAKDQAGETALHVAAQEGCTEAVIVLVKAGADINAKDHQGNTPLKRAIAYEQTAAAATLRSLGAKE